MTRARKPIISYSKLSGNYNRQLHRGNSTRLYHILNCQGTITIGLVMIGFNKLYHILNCQGTITSAIDTANMIGLYHILNCQGTITSHQ